jgi:hypothetical protein
MNAMYILNNADVIQEICTLILRINEQFPKEHSSVNLRNGDGLCSLVYDLDQRCKNLPKIYKPPKNPKAPERSHKENSILRTKILGVTVQNLLATVT